VKSTCIRIGLALFACAAGVQAAVEDSACKYRETPAADAQVETTKITLLKTTPADGGDVRRVTIVAVDVEYQLTDFAPQTFRLISLLPTNTASTISPFDETETPFLTAASGRVHLCVPLARAYENQTVRWPLSLQVAVLRSAHSARTGNIVASTPWIKFNALDMPHGALERQANAPNVEYRRALTYANFFFVSRNALCEVCLQRAPELQPKLSGAYHSWKARHRDDMEFVSHLQLEEYQKSANGSATVAFQMAEDVKKSTVDAYNKMDDTQLHPLCKAILVDLREGQATKATRDEHAQNMQLLRSRTQSEAR